MKINIGKYRILLKEETRENVEVNGLLRPSEDNTTKKYFIEQFGPKAKENLLEEHPDITELIGKEVIVDVEAKPTGIQYGDNKYIIVVDDDIAAILL